MRYFVIRGFDKKKDSAGQVIDFERIDKELIAPALARCGFVGGTTGQVVEPGSIHEDMFRLILQADLVVCDITVHNANVFYELGVRHALRKKHTVLIKGSPSADKTPFDLMGDRYMPYPVTDPGQAVTALEAVIKAALVGYRTTDSPIFLMLPKLAEADVSGVTLVPLDFVEDVKRAEARADKGWLRLMAEELSGTSFEWEGLKLVGRAQWTLRDYSAARDSWERIRKADAQDLDANLALANILERLFKATGRVDLLEESNQAIQRVLEREDLRPAYRSEALALEGRNLKTLWRLGFEKFDTADKRRGSALDGKLMRSYEAYRDAYKADLNNFFPGIAAFQMGCILKSLSVDSNFENLFTRDRRRAAQRYREDLERDVASLEHVVRASIERALESEEGDNLVWAKISAADLLFLTEPEQELLANPRIAIDAYTNAVSKGSFFWDAACGQLTLFAKLGIRTEVAEAVIQTFDGPSKPSVQRKKHLIVFSGHTVDRPDSPKARFPASAEPKAHELIQAALAKLWRDDEDTVCLSSVAPGADIVALEACITLKMASWLCLPMEKQLVAREIFGQYDDLWRNRLFAIIEAHPIERTFILHSIAGLPRWLGTRAVTPWERGNRWMLHLAESWGADRVTLLALWDRSETDASLGGTAQMVRLARNSGAFRVEVIDCNELLKA